MGPYVALILQASSSVSLLSSLVAESMGIVGSCMLLVCQIHKITVYNYTMDSMIASCSPASSAPAKGFLNHYSGCFEIEFV